MLAATMPTGGTSKGVVKIHGRLVEMQARYEGSPELPSAMGLTLVADGIRIIVEPPTDGNAAVSNGSQLRKTTAQLQLEAGLRVGYRGFYGCNSQGD
ncbi:hypothetical protein [Novilysobacter arseniciresistens]|uniref:hypothetical protein n=1 Tax=Novilysobacter arseniciresistens TaxID=1385522 RepID=UPI001269CCCC|nr:hypothetical protein [Lysobacter arseniciresistens]